MFQSILSSTTALETTPGAGKHNTGWLSGGSGWESESPGLEPALPLTCCMLGGVGTDRGDTYHRPFMAEHLQLGEDKEQLRAQAAPF